ncbi:sigma-70 family RNA polymerase sigma factor [Nocardiopsis alkaliphila]|uniref:sigma-70 family RNA polymerase sigma factor n=1 Tax=Nocardiopsis alkaliphila TaxID=225762 RepID=UPI00034CEB2C|nr:sigma-70 family RNA polymerase sigma factor [Nocardiopsis alkaliphila]
MPVSTTTTRPTEATAAKNLSGEPSEEASPEDLLSMLKNLEQSDPRAAGRLRERITWHYQPLLHRLARRYSGRGEQEEDLRQTAHVGLAKAIRGYSPARGDFIRYLMPTVTGEIKRHFRDRTWAVHTPRDPQARRSEMRQVRRDLEQRLARTPTIDEIAREMGLSREQVEEVRLVSEAYNTVSLNAPEPREEGPTTRWERYLGVEDHNLDLVVERASVRPALRALSAREKLIIKRRFFDEWTQARIAKEVGCSQMHVSRLLTASLRKLREELSER